METIRGLDLGLPNADTLFWRFVNCASVDLILEEYTKIVKRNIEVVMAQIRRRRFIIAIDETYNPFYGKIKDQWIHDKRDKRTYKISTYITILPDYKGFDWVFAANIKYEGISGYVGYYKRRWSIGTTFRVQDEVKIRTKTLIPEIRFELLVFECLLYNVWQFFRGRVPFRREYLLISCSGGASSK